MGLPSNGFIRIRDAQMAQIAAAQRAAARRRIEPRALALLAESWPSAVAALTEADRLALVRAAFDRAEGWGLEGESQLLTYLNCRMALGADFEGDPSCRWAQEALSSAAPPHLKAARLRDGALAELRLRAGKG